MIMDTQNLLMLSQNTGLPRINSLRQKPISLQASAKGHLVCRSCANKNNLIQPTLAQWDGFVPVEIALGISHTGGDALADETVAMVATELNGAPWLQASVAEDGAVERR
uniref:Uncharacterized protein n=1 Tax=Sphaerodactylus townsendi TaxID=933632 RepID=A0ACB8FR12_9SAUR